MSKKVSTTSADEPTIQPRINSRTEKWKSKSKNLFLMSSSRPKFEELSVYYVPPQYHETNQARNWDRPREEPHNPPSLLPKDEPSTEQVNRQHSSEGTRVAEAVPADPPSTLPTVDAALETGPSAVPTRNPLSASQDWARRQLSKVRRWLKKSPTAPPTQVQLGDLGGSQEVSLNPDEPLGRHITKSTDVSTRAKANSPARTLCKVASRDSNTTPSGPSAVYPQVPTSSALQSDRHLPLQTSSSRQASIPKTRQDSHAQHAKKVSTSSSSYAPSHPAPQLWPEPQDDSKIGPSDEPREGQITEDDCEDDHENPATQDGGLYDRTSTRQFVRPVHGP